MDADTFLVPSVLWMQVGRKDGIFDYETSKEYDVQMKQFSQVGIKEIVAPFRVEYAAPGAGEEDGRLGAVAKHLKNKYGMKLRVIERMLPHDQIVRGGPGRDEQVDQIKRLIAEMGRAGVEILCYNWMPSDGKYSFFIPCFIHSCVSYCFKRLQIGREHRLR